MAAVSDGRMSDAPRVHGAHTGGSLAQAL